MSEFDDNEVEEEYPEDIPRTAQEIARRVLALSAILTVVYDSSPYEVLKWLETEGLTDDVSPCEMKFLKGRTSDDDRIALTWRVECLAVLLWSICKIDALPTMSQQCDTEPLKLAVVFPPGRTREYIASARLRDRDEIDTEYETVFNAHWTVRDARINSKPMPDDLDPEVVYERHYAFNWVIGYDGQAWDDITTDT